MSPKLHRGLPFLPSGPGGGPPPAWTPADLQDLAYWWKPESIVAPDGDGVYSWPDEQVGLDLAQTTGSKKPQLVSPYINGLDGVQFDGVDDALKTPSITAMSAPTTMAAIVGFQVSSSGNYVWEGGAASTRRALLETSGTRWQMYSGASIVGGVVGVGDYYLVSEYGLNGYLRDKGVEELSGSTGTQSVDGFTLAAETSQSTGNGAVTIVEFVVVDGSLSAPDLTELENYLATRSGL